MMVGTSELGGMFKAGKTRGWASRTTIVDGKSKTYLVDYGWAVLAERDKKSGLITYYAGWDKYSPTTSKHISQLGLRSSPRIMMERKKLADVV
jgi:hypothetical protein